MTDKAKLILYSALLISFGIYSGFIYTQDSHTQPSNMNEALAGKEIWQQKNCTACHQIYGLGGFMGPDLTNVYSAPGKGPAYIKAFVQVGTNVMPAFNLSETELDQLVRFFERIDASGKADPKNFKRNLNGTIEYK
ncbi:MAG TPA: cytochrome c [Cyclobacteriaceae bacterium]|nr:cytochrome c [Cyclobacteriaceae bacterium]HNU41497.1 cytochrome c [Cyclobacteriaceae bacterium]